MSESEFPEVPTTAAQLAARWAQRDAEYAKATHRLSPDAVAAVRVGREREAGLLPNKDDRARMWSRANSWVQPVGQDFGGLKDFLE